MTEIFKKLATARAMIKKSPIKKAGKNTFSNYDYFTPEQISHMVHEAETANGLVHLFNMERAEHGIHGKLSIIDTETGETLTFIQATEIPEIKATNAAQQIGGAVTYTRRYMLMTAYDIADNSLDFDARDNRDVKSKPVMPDDRFKKMLDYLKTRPQDAAKQLSKVRDQFRFSDAQEAILIEWEGNL